MIGVAISTHRRPQVLARALEGWGKHIGPAELLVVTHDLFGAGVAATKNRGIAALMDAGCDHLFLADDDVWPVTDDWAKPYVYSDEPHLMHCWGKNRFVAHEVQTGLSVWSWPRGVLLYVERRVVEKVGGMRTEFGQWGGEHAEWSRRINNAGLTRYEFQDVWSAREGVWHCEDYTRATPSSVPRVVRDDPARVARRRALQKHFQGSTEFVNYREE